MPIKNICWFYQNVMLPKGHVTKMSYNQLKCSVTKMYVHTRANRTGGAVAWLLKLKSKMSGDAYLLQCFPGLSQYNFVLPLLQ